MEQKERRDEMEETKGQTKRIVDKGNGKALLPFLIFAGVYLGSGLIMNWQGIPMAFYQIPPPIAVSIGVIAAFLLLKGTFEEKFTTFVKGCGDANIIIMCIVFLLAGGFAKVCSTMGGIDSTVNLGLTYIPSEYLAVGIFIISSFIATATGTSVGSAAAVGPIAVAIADKAGISLPLILGCVVGGIMLGDNLSIISDTTIAATRTQECDMKDKFKLNFWLTLFPAIVTIILLILCGEKAVVADAYYPFDIVKVIPYIFVLVAAIVGVNVFMVLVGGIFLAGAIGLGYGDLTIMTFMKAIYEGFLNMTDIFLFSMLTGGLATMVNKAGGVAFLLHKIERYIRGKKSAQLGISALVSITDLALANNTVAIIINGEIAKRICYTFHVDPRRSAALLSTFSTIFQGLIPYGAQMLVIMSFTKGNVSPLDVLPYTWFLYLLGISAIISIFIPFSDRLIQQDPWDFETGMPVSKSKKDI